MPFLTNYLHLAAMMTPLMMLDGLLTTLITTAAFIFVVSSNDQRRIRSDTIYNESSSALQEPDSTLSSTPIEEDTSSTPEPSRRLTESLLRQEPGAGSIIVDESPPSPEDTNDNVSGEDATNGPVSVETHLTTPTTSTRIHDWMEHPTQAASQTVGFRHTSASQISNPQTGPLDVELGQLENYVLGMVHELSSKERDLRRADRDFGVATRQIFRLRSELRRIRHGSIRLTNENAQLDKDVRQMVIQLEHKSRGIMELEDQFQDIKSSDIFGPEDQHGRAGNICQRFKAWNKAHADEISRLTAEKTSLEAKQIRGIVICVSFGACTRPVFKEMKRFYRKLIRRLEASQQNIRVATLLGGPEKPVLSNFSGSWSDHETALDRIAHWKGPDRYENSLGQALTHSSGYQAFCGDFNVVLLTNMAVHPNFPGTHATLMRQEFVKRGIPLHSVSFCQPRSLLRISGDQRDHLVCSEDDGGLSELTKFLAI